MFYNFLLNNFEPINKDLVRHTLFVIANPIASAE